MGKVGQSCCLRRCHHPGLPADSGLLPGDKRFALTSPAVQSPLWEGPAFWKLLLPGARKDRVGPRAECQEEHARSGYIKPPGCVQLGSKISSWPQMRGAHGDKDPDAT
ncbi:hypothetical protein CB1_000505002 [Camelus ferus]|nr:hypothetical protein CB1_000505002 [Camelus ferus]